MASPQVKIIENDLIQCTAAYRGHVLEEFILNLALSRVLLYNFEDFHGIEAFNSSSNSFNEFNPDDC